MSSEQQKTQFGEYSDEELAALAKQSTDKEVFCADTRGCGRDRPADL